MPQSRFRIIHFSDPHIALFSFRHGGFFDKRLFGRLNHCLRRRRSLRLQRLQQAAELFASLEPDLLVCSGDLTSVGDPDEFALAERLLAPILELAGERFLYIPGNHDAYVQDRRCRQALETTFHRLNRKAFHLQKLPASLVLGPSEIILGNSARPSPIYSSNGAFSSQEWERLESQLMSAKNTPFRLLLQHFPTLDSTGRPLGWRRRLKQAEQLLQWQQKNAFDALLCGHIHRPFLLEAPLPRIVCAGSLTLYGSFAIIDLDSNNNSIQCKIEKLA
ncbi:MAG: metallophosphoesterase [Porticoccaceae bacterium]|nr:metallophosphoesterase [Porticoccaceae bacterium]